jgi:3-phenylpropionate/cinnamic acid dioxygenase small subunit
MTDLASLLDERAIREQLAHFARVLDKKDWGALCEVFSEALTYNYGAGGEQAGLGALETTMRTYLDVCGATQHLIGSIAMEINGDEAVSRAYVQARHVGAGAKAHLHFDTNGEYHDVWRREAVGWRIVRREAMWFMQVGDASVLAMVD